MSINYIREMLGTEIDATQAQPVPAPHPDSVDSTDNIRKYALAKPVLEHPMVNPILVSMKVLETLNPFNVDSYYNMAKWVTEALSEFAEENKDTPQSISFNAEFSMQYITETPNSFSEEFLTEFTKSQFMSTPQDGESEMDIPPQSSGWLDKLASKFGISELGIKDFIYLYLIKKYSDKGDAGIGDDRAVARTPSQISGFPVTEGHLLLIMENLPSGMKGWIQSIEARYQEEHGENWKKELYATAIKKLKKRKDAVGVNESTDDDAEEHVEMVNEIEIEEGTGDIKAGADTPDHVEDCKDRKGPVASSKVKSDIKQRLKEIANLIAKYREKEHFFGEVKPSIFNAKNSLEFIQGKISDGGMCAYKEAQIHFQTLMSPITELFPPSLIKFLAYGGDGEESESKTVKVLIPIED